ncbi:MAG: ecdysteroid 22-kinase family protein [bacterium]|nr:ecdysteroid 22-kinase family protein [bacterium]
MPDSPAFVFPKHEDDLTPELLTHVLSQDRPGLVVEGLSIVDAARAASGRASTADRLVLDLDYASGTAPKHLPRRVVLKTMLDVPHAPAVMYETEVRFYREIRPDVPFEAPVFFGALFDRESGHFGILLEDLRERGGVFANVTMDISLDQIRQLVGDLAALHARHWQSPTLDQDFGWMATPGGGGMEAFWGHTLPQIEQHMEDEPWRHDLIAPLGRDMTGLHADMMKIAAGPLEAAPRTLLHGDTHLGNTYVLPDGRMGWLDFQLSHRGCFIRDVTYIITTGLSVDLRRVHERALLDFYLEELARHGVTEVPDREATWTLHRQATFWGLVIGWGCCPIAHYGLEITQENMRRLSQIMIDLDVLEVVPD